MISLCINFDEVLSSYLFFKYFYMYVGNVMLTFKSVDTVLKATIQMKATEQCFYVVLFMILYKVLLMF